jgi:hypothetical protein
MTTLQDQLDEITATPRELVQAERPAVSGNASADGDGHLEPVGQGAHRAECGATDDGAAANLSRL